MHVPVEQGSRRSVMRLVTTRRRHPSGQWQRARVCAGHRARSGDRVGQLPGPRVTDAERAAFEDGCANRDETFLKFVLVEDSVMVYLYLSAYPFAPEHLRAMDSVMSQAVDWLDDDLVPRVVGHRSFEAAPEPEKTEGPEGLLADEASEVDTETDAIHPAMLTWLQLGAARLVRFPRARGQRLRNGPRPRARADQWNSGQEIAWR